MRLRRQPATRDDECRDFETFTTREYVAYTHIADCYLTTMKRVRKEEKKARRTKRTWLTSWMYDCSDI